MSKNNPNPSKRRQTMIKKLGSEEAYLESMRLQASKGGKVKKNG